MLGVGIYSRVKAGDWSDLVKDVSVVDAANLLIASGAFVMVIGFVGCCGALKQMRPLLVVVSEEMLQSLLPLTITTFSYLKLLVKNYILVHHYVGFDLYP